jgi:transcriptional regulator with XRE-family HTH domain
LILEQIENWCKENNTSISALEKKCGLGNATIGKWDKSMPRIDTLQKVSDVTKIPITKLIGNSKK